MKPPRPLLVTDLSARSQPGARRRPWALLLGLVGLLVLVDLVIALVRPGSAEPPLADDLPRARQAMQRAVEDEHAWLLLGDSVLAGDVMRGTVPEWTEHRVLDYLRREQSSEATVGFQQIALDGMLPVDMLHVVDELDGMDPGGEVGLVLEINPRFFSTHYAKQRACTRPFLCELGSRLDRPARWAFGSLLWDESQRWLLDHLPVVRHRELFPHFGGEQRRALVTPLEAESKAQGELFGQARVLEHYRRLKVDRNSIQFRALENLVTGLRAHGRPALLFATPLNSGVMKDTLEGDDYGKYIAALDRMINREGDSSVRFLSLDHPSLRDAWFLDHAHLKPKGNRWLALNLLHQLGVGMAVAPPRTELAYEEGVDRSLVARIERGNREGAPWQAQMTHPQGIAVSPGGGRVVVADTGNHCVRELVGPKTTLRTLAGRPGRAGKADGRALRAKFTAPRHPVLIGERVYVVDGKRRARLREISEGRVRTLEPTSGPGWSKIDTMRSDGRDLWLVDESRRVIRFDPRTGVSELRHHSARPDFVALDLGPDGRIYLADRGARLWQLSPGDDEPVLIFANEAVELLPQGGGSYFPFAFDEMALENIVGMRYVARYDGLLVQDEHSADAHERTVTERIHLRFVSLSDGKIYPWVHPLVHGGGQMFHNRHTRALSSNMHLGSMDIDPESATLLYVEKERSRVLELSDGLLGVAKLGHHITPTAYGGLEDVFGRQAGVNTMLGHHPERWAHRRLESIPRQGPYFGLMMGSSMTSVTEVVGQYSMARIVERELGRELALRDGIRFDMIQRAYRGPRLAHIVGGFVSFVEHQSPVDVLFIETHSGRLYRGLDTSVKMAEAVDRIRLAAARYRTLVVILDNDAMTSRRRDGLRGSTDKHRQFLEICESVGFIVIRPGDLLLREAIDHAPWGNAPFTGAHASTWAMDLTARALAELAYPAIGEHLRGRRPALARARAGTIGRTASLHSAFAEAGAEWAAAAVEVPREAMQLRLSARHLQVLVDLGRAGYPDPLSAEERDAIVLGTLVHAVVRDPAGKLGDRVTVTLSRFGNYDEYGVGVLEGAEVIEERSLKVEALAEFLAEMATSARR